MPEKIYTTSLRWKIFLFVIGFPLGVGGAAGVWYFGTGHEVTNNTELYSLTGISLVIAATGFWCMVYPLFSKILILHGDALIVPGLFRNTVISKHQISGYRILTNQSVRVLQLLIMRRNGAAKKKNISMLFTPDDVLFSWFSDIPNIDEAELTASIQDIQSDERLGETPEERLGSIDKAQTIGRTLNSITLITFGWAIFYPHPPFLLFVVLTSLPLIALWLCQQYEGAFSIDDTGKKTARVELTFLLMTPGFILALRALLDIHILDATQLIVPTLIGLVIVVFGIISVAPSYRRNIGKLLLMTMLMSAYPAGAITIANALFDQAPTEQHMLAVTGKRISSGKVTSHYFKINNRNSAVGKDEVRVTKELYQQTDTGQNICFIKHSGAIGISWYTVEPATSCKY